MSKSKLLKKLRFIRKIFRSFGWDINRYDFISSPYVQLTQLLREARVTSVVDVGSNVGQFAIEIRRHGYQGKIISFEPIELCHKQIIKKAKYDPQWIIAERCALGDKEGQANINISYNQVSSSILPMTFAHLTAAEKSYYTNEELVRVNKLDDILDEYVDIKPPFFIKIDVQGYEWQVLDGASRSLERANGLIIELSLVELYSGQRLWIDLVLRLEKLGFTLWSLHRGFSDRKTGQLLQIDAIFIRQKSFEQK